MKSSPRPSPGEGTWSDGPCMLSFLSNRQTTLNAWFWSANGELRADTATFATPSANYGNCNGSLVPEGLASDRPQGTGSFFLKCELGTCGRFTRSVYQEIYPCKPTLIRTATWCLPILLLYHKSRRSLGLTPTICAPTKGARPRRLGRQFSSVRAISETADAVAGPWPGIWGST